METRRSPGLVPRQGADGKVIWHIDKRIRGYGRLCESTGEGTQEAAERYLARRMEELREVFIYGKRPRRLWRAAVTKYLTDYSAKRSIGQDADQLTIVDPYLRDKWLDEVHSGTLEPYFKDHTHLARSTLVRAVAPVRRILTLAARSWREEGSNLTWLAEVPLIEIPPKYGRPGKRKAYPLDWTEQELFFEELAPHLERMASFDVHTGLRDQELCALQWEWEQRIPELDTPTIRRSVFVLPSWLCKNKEPRVVVLNDRAQAIIEEMRGVHPKYVFTYEDKRNGYRRDRLARMLSSGWRAARRRASKRYKEVFGREPPEGFRTLRVHDLRHTFGRRLRAAGVSQEDRRDLLGHKSGSVTTEYSAAELGNLIDAVNRIIASRKNPAPTLLRLTG